MGTKAHSRIFLTPQLDPPVRPDIAAMIDEEINPREYLSEITPRGMAALLSVEI